MKERPILFSGPMVRAIMEGRKTQTRRVVKDVSADCELFIDSGDGFFQQCYRDNSGAIHSKSWLSKCPYGIPGDRLWVRETFAIATGPPPDVPMDADNTAVVYRASWDVEVPETPLDGAWKPSIHMPRWASRINLEITGVMVERLQEINCDDAIAEGTDWKTCPTYQSVESLKEQVTASRVGRPYFPVLTIDYVGGYKKLWESINGPGSWDKNPWVWVVKFRRIDNNA